MLTEAKILEFLRRELRVDVAGVTAETLLFSSGRVDSLAMVDLMGFLEREGRFHMDPLDVTLENLDSIARILAYVANRRG